MKRFGIVALALVLAVGASTAIACDKAHSGCTKTATVASAKTGCSKAAAETASAKEGCAKTASAAEGCAKACAKTCDKADYCVEASLARAMAMMPHMTYRVGDMTTECCKTATAKAEATNEPIVYLVGDKSFHCKMSAMKALASHMDKQMPTLAKATPVVEGKPMHCSKMATELASAKNTNVKYSVAGVQFDCPKEAEAVAAKLAAKMDEFRASCSKSGCAKAASSASGCAKTASKSGCCSKGAETASAKSSGCAKTASKSAGEAVAAEAEASSDESPELAQAKQVVRQMVEFVSAQRAS